MIVAVSDFVRAQFCAILIAIGVGAAAFYTWIKQPGRGAQFDRLHAQAADHRRQLSQVLDLADGAHAGDAAGGGIPLVNALEIAARSTGNRYMGKELEIVVARVREGQGFASTLLERQVVPDVAIKMIEVGESTGALTEMLNSLADFYDEEIETEVGAVRDVDRAGDAGVHGRRHRRHRAGALPAALPADLGDGR